MKKSLYTIIALILVGCNTNPVLVESQKYELTIDPRLPKKDGVEVYNLTLQRDRIQTVHYIGGSLLESEGSLPFMNQQIKLESSHYLSFNPNDSAVTLYHRNIGFDGNWVVVDSQKVESYDDITFPIVNDWSYTDNLGEFSGMIAPTIWMVGDTITIEASWSSKWYQTDTIRKTIKIALH